MTLLSRSRYVLALGTALDDSPVTTEQRCSARILAAIGGALQSARLDDGLIAGCC